MSQIIVKLDSKTDNWTVNKRVRVGQPIIHNAAYWANETGANSEPGVGNDWKFVGYVNGSAKEPFTATAAQTEFVLNNTPNNVDVFIDRVVQIETIDYNLAGDTVTMTFGVDLNSKVEIRKY